MLDSLQDVEAAPPDAEGSPAAHLAWRQDGVLSRAQLLDLGVTRDTIAAHVRARRWRLVGRVVVLHRGPLTERQRAWVAVLHAGPRALLAGRTAAALAGLSGFPSDTIDVIAAKSSNLRRIVGMAVHETRWLPDPDTRHTAAPPRTSVERSVVDAAMWQKNRRVACGLVAAAVQQRLTTAAALRRVALERKRYRHRGLILGILDDIEGGGQALSEIDFARLCRRFGLPEPIRQERRRDETGRVRYLDVVWKRRDGRIVVVEIDGALHLRPMTYWDDMSRQNALTVADHLVLRFPSFVVRTEPEVVIRQLRRALAM